MFRACEIFCNHSARILSFKRCLSSGDKGSRLRQLNQERINLQRELNIIGRSHGDVCAECKGKCCGGIRERDAFIDRILQDPDTVHRNARRKEGMNVSGGEIAGYCRELTCSGCRIPYELRPIQCTAYFCGKAVDKLSSEERAAGIKAVKGLMAIQLQTVRLMLK